MFCGWTENSAKRMIGETVLLEALGFSVPAAVEAAHAVGFNLQGAAMVRRDEARECGTCV